MSGTPQNNTQTHLQAELTLYKYFTFTSTHDALLTRYVYSNCNAFKLRVLLDEQLVLLALVA